eukprot:jgi/Botrbrau1/11012/Bobra.101_1s0010.1
MMARPDMLPATDAPLDSPFANILEEVSRLSLDDQITEAECSSAVSIPSRSDTKASDISSELYGSSLVSTPSLPWSELSFSTGISRNSANGGWNTLGDSGSFNASRGLDTVGSTRCSSMAVPSIPEGMERLASDGSHDHLPSPFSDPTLQTDPIDDGSNLGPDGDRPPTFFNPSMTSGLKSLSGSEANLYLQLTEELANDPDLAELLADQTRRNFVSNQTILPELGDEEGPSKELIEKLRTLLPADEMQAFLCQMNDDVSARRQRPQPAGVGRPAAAAVTEDKAVS